MAGAQVQEVELPEVIFGAEVNVGLMHQAFVRQMANMRRGTATTKSRSQVRTSKSKIYRQKGTGRARHGSRNAPIFVGGGIAHGPKNRDYTQKMPRKMRRQALRSTLSAVVRDDQLVLLDAWELAEPKTKLIAQALNNVAGTQNVLVVLTDEDKNGTVYRSARNLPSVTVLNVRYLNIRDLLKHDKVIMPLNAYEWVVSTWGEEK